MNDLIQFILTALQTPRLAIALLFEAVQSQWATLACAGMLIIAFVGLSQYKRRWFTVKSTAVEEQQPDAEEALYEYDNRAFQEWYQQRLEDSQIIATEEQARRLYVAFLANQKIVESQVASEVIEQ